MQLEWKAVHQCKIPPPVEDGWEEKRQMWWRKRGGLEEVWLVFKEMTQSVRCWWVTLDQPWRHRFFRQTGRQSFPSKTGGRREEMMKWKAGWRTEKPECSAHSSKWWEDGTGVTQKRRKELKTAWQLAEIQKKNCWRLSTFASSSFLKTQPSDNIGPGTQEDQWEANRKKKLDLQTAEPL